MSRGINFRGVLFLAAFGGRKRLAVEPIAGGTHRQSDGQSVRNQQSINVDGMQCTVISVCRIDGTEFRTVWCHGTVELFMRNVADIV